MASQDRSPETGYGSGTVHARNARMRAMYVELSQLAVEADRAGDGATAARLRTRMHELANRFVTANADLVAPVARRFRTDGSQSHWNDFDQAGLLGLWEAFQKWDPDQSTFGTFSRKYIRGRIGREVAAIEHSSISYHDFTARDKILKVRSKLAERAGTTPDHREVAAAASAELGRTVTVDQVERVTRTRPASLDRKVSDPDGAALIDLLGPDDIERPARPMLDPDLLDQLTADLDPIELYVVVRHLGLDGSDGESFAALAAACGLGREKLRRHYHEALARLATDTDDVSDDVRSDNPDRLPV